MSLFIFIERAMAVCHLICTNYEIMKKYIII
jgi:hypothetical protein